MRYRQVKWDINSFCLQVPQQNEMLSYTVLQLVLLVKMKNIIPIKVPNGWYLKNLILQTFV